MENNEINIEVPFGVTERQSQEVILIYLSSLTIQPMPGIIVLQGLADFWQNCTGMCTL